jgi:hypothetical protein
MSDATVQVVRIAAACPLVIALVVILLMLKARSLSDLPRLEPFEPFEPFEQEAPPPVPKLSQLESARMDVEAATRVTIAANAKARDAAAQAATPPITADKTEQAERALDDAKAAQANQDAANARLMLVASGEEYRQLAAKALHRNARRSEAEQAHSPQSWEMSARQMHSTSPTSPTSPDPSYTLSHAWARWKNVEFKGILAWAVLGVSIVLAFALGYGIAKRNARSRVAHEHIVSGPVRAVPSQVHIDATEFMAPMATSDNVQNFHTVER